MVVDIVVKNCKIVGPNNIVAAGIAISKGRVVAITRDEDLPEANKVIDAEGKYVLPGLVDTHAHLSYPPEIDLATHLRAETQACAYGGITTTSNMIDIPGNLVEETKKYIDAFNKTSYVDGGLTTMMVTERDIGQCRELIELGIIGFKLLVPYKGEEAQPGIPSVDDGFIYLAMEEIAKQVKEGYKVHCRVHCENVEPFFRFKARARKQGIMPRSYNEIRPRFLEQEAMHRMIFFANVTGCPLYIVHMTIKDGIGIIAKARAEGITVIAETCPQYLVLNEDNVDMLQSKVNPPIRTKEDNEALWAAIKDGVINHVATDHAPVPKKFKTDFWTAKMGMAGAETWLPIMLSEGVNKGRITLERLVEVCCTNPAKQYGLFPEKGIIAVGSDADLVLIDLNKEATVSEKPVFSLTEYNPYAGFKFKGWPTLTMLRGAVIATNGTVIGKEGYGKYHPAKIK